MGESSDTSPYSCDASGENDESNATTLVVKEPSEYGLVWENKVLRQIIESKDELIAQLKEVNMLIKDKLRHAEKDVARANQSNQLNTGTIARSANNLIVQNNQNKKAAHDQMPEMDYSLVSPRRELGQNKTRSHVQVPKVNKAPIPARNDLGQNISKPHLQVLEINNPSTSSRREFARNKAKAKVQASETDSSISPRNKLGENKTRREMSNPSRLARRKLRQNIKKPYVQTPEIDNSPIPPQCKSDQNKRKCNNRFLKKHLSSINKHTRVARELLTSDTDSEPIVELYHSDNTSRSSNFEYAKIPNEEQHTVTKKELSGVDQKSLTSDTNSEPIVELYHSDNTSQSSDFEYAKIPNEEQHTVTKKELSGVDQKSLTSDTESEPKVQACEMDSPQVSLHELDQNKKGSNTVTKLSHANSEVNIRTGHKRTNMEQNSAGRNGLMNDPNPSISDKTSEPELEFGVNNPSNPSLPKLGKSKDTVTEISLVSHKLILKTFARTRNRKHLLKRKKLTKVDQKPLTNETSSQPKVHICKTDDSPVSPQSDLDQNNDVNVESPHVDNQLSEHDSMNASDHKVSSEEFSRILEIFLNDLINNEFKETFTDPAHSKVYSYLLHKFKGETGTELSSKNDQLSKSKDEDQHSVKASRRSLRRQRRSEPYIQKYKMDNPSSPSSYPTSKTEKHTRPQTYVKKRSQESDQSETFGSKSKTGGGIIPETRELNTATAEKSEINKDKTKCNKPSIESKRKEDYGDKRLFLRASGFRVELTEAELKDDLNMVFGRSDFICRKLDCNLLGNPPESVFVIGAHISLKDRIFKEKFWGEEIVLERNLFSSHPTAVKQHRARGITSWNMLKNRTSRDKGG